MAGSSKSGQRDLDCCLLRLLAAGVVDKKNERQFEMFPQAFVLTLGGTRSSLYNSEPIRIKAWRAINTHSYQPSTTVENAFRML